MRRVTLALSVLTFAAAFAPGCPDSSSPTLPTDDIGADFAIGDTADAQPDSAQPDAPDAADVSSDEGAPDASADTADTDGAPTCTDACTDEGALSCDGATVTQCADGDDDGCLEWVDLIGCGAGTTCSDGTCVAQCPDQPCTAVGAKSCDGNAVVTCGDYDADGCLEWGDASDCANLVCSNGFCAVTCSDACTVVGAKKCEGNFAVSCADHDTNGCLEWGDPVDCEPNVCSNGFCASSCTDECTVVGSKECEAGGVKTCDNYDGDSCLEWGTPVACDAGQTCSNGACATTCSDECTAAGAKQCDASGNVETCNDYNSDSCLEWGSGVPCAAGQVCAGGECTDTCQSECTVIGAKQCDVGGNVETCDDYNSDGCLEWGSPVACAAGLVCSGGNCASTCTDECDFVNDKQCVAGSQVQYQSCGDYDADSCLEWGTPQNCGASLVCSDGNCASTCTDGCPSDGATQCSGNAVQLCGDYNADSCVEWGTPVACAAYEECASGACSELPPPATVLVAEFMIDSTGSPDTDAFVELYAPAGTDLAGYSLVGVNGNGGGDYATVELGGIVASDGRHVIAHSGAASFIADMADATDDGVDFQNGPDSIQVRFGSTVVDAVGYGSFGSGDVFAGEGSPVAKPPANSSLTRDDANTDTDDNSVDFSASATPTPGAAPTPDNLPPTAALSCPGSAAAGASVTLDGSGSSDSDGSIVDYAFDFGDTTPDVSGASASVDHAFANAGDYTVTLTVTDDQGATGQAQCTVNVAAADGPAVVFIKPIVGATATQGASFQVLVDATPAAGKSVTQVALQVDGVAFGTPDTSAPYEWTYTVPSGAATGSSLSFVALATDDTGGVGVSDARVVQVTNDVPEASFTAVVSGALEVTADANSSSDTETADADLEVRFDWTDDGTWDTAFSTDKVVSHTYPAEGDYTVRMEVRDEAGQTAQATRNVSLSLIQTVSGTVTTTTWVGTIVVTGDVVVPAGETLTVAAGTNVLFTPTDQDNDGVGDYDIEVDGQLVVAGTEAEPVLFTVFGADKDPLSWNQIRIDGDGSQIDWAIFEYGQDCLELDGDVTINDTIVRFCDNGVRVLSGASPATIARLTASDNSFHGVRVDAGTTDMTESMVESSGDSGVLQRAGTLNLADSTVQTSGAAGIEYLGGTGLVTRNLVTANAFEGVRVLSTHELAEPTPVINLNNIYGNATFGALRFMALSESLSSSYSGTTDPVGNALTAPNNEAIEGLYVTFSNSSSLVTLQIRAQGSNTVLATIPNDDTSWVNISPADTTGVHLRIDDGTQYGSGSASATWLAYTEAGAFAEVAVTDPTGVDLRHNYYGVWPNVLSALSYVDHDEPDIEGFVGVPFDDTWDKGPYVGGEAEADGTTWSGTVYVTGRVDVQAGDTLTVAAGTQVEFAPIDQDEDGVGDYAIRVAGAFTTQGTSGSPVVITSHAASPQAGDFVGIYTQGSSADVTLDYTDIAYADDALVLGSGATGALDTVAVVDCAHDGVRVLGGTTTADKLVLDNCGRAGLFVSGSANLTLTNSSVSNNTTAGLIVANNAAPTVDHCTIQYNGMGVFFDTAGAAQLTASNVKFNDHEGVAVMRGTPAITGNNIYGNAVVAGPVIADVGLSISSSYSGTTDPVTTAWSTPAGQAVRFVQTAFSNSSSLVTGQVQTGFGGTTLVTIPNDDAELYSAILDTTTSSIRGRIDDGTQYGSGSLTLARAVYRAADTPVELLVLTAGATIDATGNYWGVFPDVESRMVLSGTSVVDYQGFEFVEISGTGPQ